MRLKHLMTLKYEIRERSESIGFLSVMGEGAWFLSLRLVHQFCMGKEPTVMAARAAEGKFLLLLFRKKKKKKNVINSLKFQMPWISPYESHWTWKIILPQKSYERISTAFQGFPEGWGFWWARNSDQVAFLPHGPRDAGSILISGYCLCGDPRVLMLLWVFLQIGYANLLQRVNECVKVFAWWHVTDWWIPKWRGYWTTNEQMESQIITMELRGANTTLWGSILS